MWNKLIIGSFFLLTACATSHEKTPLTGTSIFDYEHQNWGFVLIEPGSLDLTTSSPIKIGMIGKGGFENEASCLLAADKFLSNLANPNEFEPKCFWPYRTSEKKSFKVVNH